MSADTDTIREALAAPSKHHDRCNTRTGGECDCYMRHYTPALEALAALERRVQELEQALAEIERLADKPYWDDPVAGVGPIARAVLAGGEETPA